MPDISMCTNIKCPLKEDCYRFNAPVNPYRQSYANFNFEKDSKGKTTCQDQIPYLKLNKNE